jgi:hypothetical protein
VRTALRLSFLLIIGALAPLLLALGPPPPNPCDGAVISASQVVVTFRGLVSGCSEKGGTCLVGETIVFTASTSRLCVLSDFWLFPGEAVVAGTTINHVFTTSGTFTLKMIAAGPTNSVVILKTVTVAPVSAIPMLGVSAMTVLLISIAAVATYRLR